MGSHLYRGIGVTRCAIAVIGAGHDRIIATNAITICTYRFRTKPWIKHNFILNMIIYRCNCATVEILFQSKKYRFINFELICILFKGKRILWSETKEQSY